VNVVSSARVLGAIDSGNLLVEVSGLPMHYLGDSIVLATGARERFLPFPGWTLPNVVGAGGLQALVQGGLPIAGKRVILAGSGPLLLAVAAHLLGHGANVAMILEQTPLMLLAKMGASLLSHPDKLVQGITYRWQTRAIPYLTSAWPLRANGIEKIASITYLHAGRQHTVPCDYLGCGFHLVPNVELAAVLGCGVTPSGVQVDDLQSTTVQGVYCAGETAGVGGLELALAEGQIAGLAAAGFPDKAKSVFPERSKQRKFALRLASAFAVRPELRSIVEKETIVCRCEDVQGGQLEGQRTWRAAKLLTRCGMGPCQGRICGPACEFLYGWTADSRRFPIQPAQVSSLIDESSGQAESVEPKSMNVELREERR
jgi:NADPH-dependent 2,4-dienoyl-CoA reductase/sulfur reductase-like enzyme